VQAYAADDGRSLGWDFNANGAVPDLALLPGDLLFVPSFNNHVYLLSAHSGVPIDPEGYRTRGWVWQQPALSDGAIYFADLEGGVYALDLATGEEIWSTEIGGTPKIKASPVIVDGTLVVVDRSRSATFLDAGTGDARARVQLGLRGGTVRAPLRLGDDGAVYFVTTRGHLWRIDAEARTAREITGEEQA
jgi:outer membrane protein assembly factor BamB